MATAAPWGGALAEVSFGQGNFCFPYWVLGLCGTGQSTCWPKFVLTWEANQVYEGDLDLVDTTATKSVPFVDMIHPCPTSPILPRLPHHLTSIGRSSPLPWRALGCLYTGVPAAHKSACCWKCFHDCCKAGALMDFGCPWCFPFPCCSLWGYSYLCQLCLSCRVFLASRPSYLSSKWGIRIWCTSTPPCPSHIPPITLPHIAPVSLFSLSGVRVLLASGQHLSNVSAAVFGIVPVSVALV